MAARTPWHRTAGPERAPVANPTEIPGFDPPFVPRSFENVEITIYPPPQERRRPPVNPFEPPMLETPILAEPRPASERPRAKWGLNEIGAPRLFPPTPVANDAEFSADSRCRYWLSRVDVAANNLAPVGLLIGLNPSKAGAEKNDQTIRKELGFASRWGWSGFWKANLFAHVETESALLRELAYDYAVGDRNDDCLREMVARAPEIVLCWGDSCPKQMRIRIAVVLGIVQKFKPHSCRVFTLGLTASGQPRHTSRIGYDTARVPWEARA